MGKMQRDKGANYEREVAKIISARLGRPTKRMLGQARDGGHDLEQIGPFLFECKRRAKIAVYEWMRQIVAACTNGQMPVVIARADNERSIVILDFEDFMTLAKCYLNKEIESGEAVTL